MGIRTGEDTDVVAGSLNGAVSHVVDGRVLVHGKLFARGGERLRLRGVTYGPFAPNREGQPFPTRRRTGDDLAGLQALGANSIRVYHVPPEWMLDLVDEGYELVSVIVTSSQVRVYFLSKPGKIAKCQENTTLSLPSEAPPPPPTVGQMPAFLPNNFVPETRMAIECTELSRPDQRKH